MMVSMEIVGCFVCVFMIMNMIAGFVAVRGDEDKRNDDGMHVRMWKGWHQGRFVIVMFYRWF